MEVGEEKIKSCFHFRALLGHVCLSDRQGMQHKLFIEIWLIIDIYFAGNWERALSSSGWQWGLGGEQGRGTEPPFPRKTAGTAELPVQSGMEGGGEGTGTRWG